MKCKRLPKLLLISALLILAAPSILLAASIKLSWQPNTEPDLKGYHIYFGTQPRNYGPPIPVDLVTTYTLAGIEENRLYYFAISAIDTNNNESGFSDEIAKLISVPDTLSPTISITKPASPSEGTFETNSTVVQLSGSAHDDREITQVAWSTGHATGVADGTANWSIPHVTVSEGLNTVVVTAVDASGNTGSASLDIKYTPPDTMLPVVTITTPTRDDLFNTASSSISLAGTAGDDGGLSQITWHSSNGASGIATGTNEWSIDDINLAIGHNIITITATDLAGNNSNDRLTAVYEEADTAAPSVTIESPTTKTKYFSRTSTISLRGKASDNIGIARVEWRNSRGEQGTCSGAVNWQTPRIKLNRWWNTITITAFDDAGNIDQKQVRVFRWR